MLKRPFDTVAAIGPGASWAAIIEAAGWPDHSGATVIVGHQPVLGEVAAQLLAGQVSSWSVKKGALWWFTHRGRDGTGITLRAVIGPDLV